MLLSHLKFHLEPNIAIGDCKKPYTGDVYHTKMHIRRLKTEWRKNIVITFVHIEQKSTYSTSSTKYICYMSYNVRFAGKVCSHI